MTSRQRNNPTSSSPTSPRKQRRSNRKSDSRKNKRQRLLETLETRNLLAGPQLIGIQPNEGDLIVDGTVRDTAPRVITFGFDANQEISPDTLDGIRITRSGTDDIFDTPDDVVITPGLVTLAENAPNQVEVRFAESLPDDNYRIEVFGFDDLGLGITALRNVDQEPFMPSNPDQRSEVIDFELRLGALIESIVPQPVIRLPDNTLTQNRDEIVVFFNEDELFIENDDNGNPTERSAENPRFYQLLLTQETVRTTDDLLFHPDQVVYDAESHTARLIFADDINLLPGVEQGGGTWRLRVGTAVDDRADLILPPTQTPVTATAVTDFNGARVTFFTETSGEGVPDRSIRFEDTGAGGLVARLEPTGVVVVDFGGTLPTIRDLRLALLADPTIDIDVRSEPNGTSEFAVPLNVLGAPPLRLSAVGETLQTATDIGLFGVGNELQSLFFEESIDPQTVLIEPLGGQDDIGHTDAVHINPDFGADVVDGITEVLYNFQPFFDADPETGEQFANQITEIQKTRIREVLNLWASTIGVQFRETADRGITFGLGDPLDLQSIPDPDAPIDDGTLEEPPEPLFAAEQIESLDAAVRIDPAFGESALIFSNQTIFGLAYGEDFTRKAASGVGLLLGLSASDDLPEQSLLSLSPFLETSIDGLFPTEPVFPSNQDVLHGNFIHRADSVDIDLFRFEVSLDDPDRLGTLTAETFAERLPDSSSLDTTLTLFEEITATAQTDFGFGPDLAVEITSLVPGRLGNNSRINFIQSDRGPGESDVRILRATNLSGGLLENTITIDLPRQGPNVTSLPANDIVDAINADPFASSIFRAEVVIGDGASNVVSSSLTFQPVVLSGGGLSQLSRNDDYFGEDSRIVTQLDEGVYYIGVAASGNDNYDPTIPQSGEGGRSQGDYQLHLKFEPQTDEVDVIRDLDSDRIGVPGAILDGDANGTPGGVNNFWFQTRPINRILNFNVDGASVIPGQTLTVTGSNGVSRIFEFTPDGASPSPGNIAVNYNSGAVGFATPPGNIALALQAAINSNSGVTGVTVSNQGTSLEFLGERSLDFSIEFNGIEALGRTIFVDKIASPFADGSLASPFNTISNPAIPNAFGSTLPGDIVRIVGNGGLDNDITTERDNLSYQIGVSDTGGLTLPDGRSLEVPMGVTTMIDAGSIFKLRNAFIGIGSSTVQVDRSGGAIQVLGTPRLVQLSPSGEPVTTTILGDENVDSPGYDDGSVIFTSTRDREADANAAGISPDAAPGNWGGLIFRRDVDLQEGRRDLEDEGIFLQLVNHAEIRYGGSSAVLIDSVQQLVNPIQIVNMRPTITFNEITQSSDSAISAAPDSFEETSYQEPRFQQAGAFTADYDRIGPEISNNRVVDNSINGLFIRATTTPTETARPITTSARFDDIDIVHYVAENLVVEASPGGSIEDGVAPSLALVTGQEFAGVGGLPAGEVSYNLTFVDRDGFESLASTDTFTTTVTNDGSRIELRSLPQVEPGGDYVSRRLYRAIGGSNDFRLVGELDAIEATFTDDGTTGEAQLDLTRQGVRGRIDASLVLDPGLVVKLRGTRIEFGQGTQLLAEGLPSNPIVLVSSQDDRFGAGGTFDTNNDNAMVEDLDSLRADWAGIYLGPTSNVSLDNVRISSAGGISLLEGGFTGGFSPLELQQATGRITNSVFEFNDVGQLGSSADGRFGRLANKPATIFVRGTQPTIVGNTFVDNLGSIIDIDLESIRGNLNADTGRQTGDNERISVLDDNHGPIIRFNRYLDNERNGLEIRGGTIDTETVFDDTDIAHLLLGDNGRDTGIIVGDLNSSGSLRLLSRADESLVVKFEGAGSPNDENAGVGLTARGEVGEIVDRVGGTIHVIGQPGSPVVLTSFSDDTVGAGLTPDGSQFTDHNGDGPSRPRPNDWRGILLDENSNDYNVPFFLELEDSIADAPGLNGTVDNAQVLGELAGSVWTSDHVARNGFEVQGFLSAENDVDAYSFIGTPGTQVWIDIDTTSFNLDTVIELLDENGRLLARSDNSFDETLATGAVEVPVFDPEFEGVTTSLVATNEQYVERGVGGLLEDHFSDNPRDAGIHFRLPGNTADPNARSVYFFRVRSASVNPDDVTGGFTEGSYRFQLRITEEQVFAGSLVRHTDIRYANNGIHLRGLMSTSPLLGEAQENENVDPVFANNNEIDGENPGSGAQYLGALDNSRNNVISVGGILTVDDIDFYRFDIEQAQRSVVFDVDFADGFNRPDTNISVYYDTDGASTIADANDSANRNTGRLIFHGSASNIADDLTSPLGENTAFEKLIRGSITNNDPFIGPIDVVPGTYYIAISPEGRDPAFLEDSIREPLVSIDRIVEDRIQGNETTGVNAPQVSELFPSVAGTGFTFSTDNQVGHGTPPDPLAPVVGSPVFPEAFITGGDAVNSFNTTDNSPLPVSLNGFPFSLAENGDVGGALGTAPGNTSTVIPHISIAGNLDGADFYSFTIVEPSRVILDIDQGWEKNTEDTQFPNVNLDPLLRSVDTTLILLQATPTGLQRVFEPQNPGDPLDIESSLVVDGESGSNSFKDAFLDTETHIGDPFDLAPGTYFIGVTGHEAAVTVAANSASAASGLTGTYTLHVSIENMPTIPVFGEESDVLAFLRPTTVDSGSITSEPFDLAGYVPEDLPFLYFNRLYDAGLGDTAELTIASDQNPAGAVAHSFTEGGWDQIRVALDDFAGHTGITLSFNYNSGGGPSFAAGLLLDDFIVGFAERGESIFGATVDDTFSGASTTGVGEYQLEIRLASETGTTGFDTNDRHNESVTLVAPTGDLVADGDTFVLGDGAANVTFEFTTTGAVEFGNSPILFSATDTASQVAEAIRAGINNQTAIALESASSGGLDTETLTDGRLLLSGTATGTFLAIPNAGSAPTELTTDSDGNLLLPAILHEGSGDENFVRSQSQIIIEHNTISDVRGIGVWSEPGSRDENPFFAVDNPLLEVPRIGNTSPGAVRNLPVLNNSVEGGLAPSLVIQNNTFDQAQFAGVKVEGEVAPWVIEPPQLINDTYNYPFGDPGIGSFIADGSTFSITAGQTTVVFEFEDIGAGAVNKPIPGSGLNGGDGVRDSNVPVYFRHPNEANGGPYLGRGEEYVALEILHAIRESIQGSILQTNGLVELVEVQIGPSTLIRGSNGFNTGFFERPALYISGASNVSSPSLVTYQAPVHEAPQPFSRIINNTFYGADGLASNFQPDPSTSEPNDLIEDSLGLNIGDGRGIFDTTAFLGDNDVPLPPEADVDFYHVFLDVGDRLVVDIDTIAGGPDTSIRIFDSSGTPLALSQNDIAPDHLEPRSAGTNLVADDVNNRDAFIDFSAPATGRYYIGVSADGNDEYDALALSGRVAGNTAVGSYDISAKVFTERSFVLSADNFTNEPDTTFSTGATLGGSIVVTFIDDIGATNQQTINVPFGSRVPDVMRALAAALNGTALGGSDGAAAGLTAFPTDNIFFPERPTVIGPTLFAPDHNTGGFGHDRQIGVGNGSTELYIFVEGISDIDISLAPGFSLDPVPGQNSDQLLFETGVLVSGGASPTLLNNVFLNLHESLVVEPTSPKGMEVIAVGNVFQHDATATTVFAANTGGGTAGNPSNVNANGGTDNFNITLGPNDPALVDPAGNDFQPRLDSLIVDSSINSLDERVALANLRASVGLPISNVLAPITDEAGILRADHPDAAPPLGIGASVFTDRGSTELADFIGPVAIAEVPRDNDSEGIDSDPAVSFINLSGGVFEEFRIQLRDNGDSSDPFTGLGIDDATVVVPEIPGLRPTGANLTLFEDEQLLVEDIDYTFNYDETRNVITLTPLAGIWDNERAYRIALNNRDQTVIEAPEPDEISDGDQFVITDSLNGQVVFEFETGFQLLVPEPITVIVPREGTNADGVRDGDIFQINDGQNPVIVFEFNSDAVTLPGTVEVPLPATPTPNNDPEGLDIFLNEIAQSIADSIQGQVDAGNLDVDVRVIDDRVVVGAEPGATAQTSGSGLLQASRTMALVVPSAGADAGGVVDGDRFIITGNNVSLQFEFSNGLAPVAPGSVEIDIAPNPNPLTSAEVAQAIVDAISLTELELNPTITGDIVYLNLPVNGTVEVIGGQVSAVGVSRTPADGDTLVVTPDNGAPSITYEFNRTDELDENGVPMDDGVLPGNIPIPLTRASTANEIATLIASELQGTPISGLNPNEVQVVDGGILSVGGEEGLGFSVDTSVEVIGARTSDGGSTINIGPLVLNLPADGGLTLADGSVLVVRDGVGNNVLFEFDGDNSLSIPTANAVPFTVFDDADELSVSLANAINIAAFGVVAEAIGNGQVSLGQIPETRVDNTNIPSITPQRGRVSDGDVITIQQGSDFVSYEFELATLADGVATGNVPVLFLPGDSAGNNAVALANAINANPGNLLIDAQAVVDLLGVPTGDIELTDLRTTTLEVSGSPSVTGSSTIEVFGPLLLGIPLVGGGGIQDGSVLILQDDVGNDILFEFDLNSNLNNPTATAVSFNSFDDVDQLSTTLVTTINGLGIGITAVYQGNGVISLGRIDDARVNTGGDPAAGIAGVPQITTTRGIVNDGEIIRIQQGTIEVLFEFESILGGGGVAGNNVQVAFQPGSSVGDVAFSLAAAINNNLGGLRLNAVAELDADGNPTGRVDLNDLPGTIVDVTAAPTLNVEGVPGGAIPVRISPLFSSVEIKEALLQALASINPAGESPVTTLVASDRGGNTLFVENGVIFSEPIRSYFLPGITDLAGNPLEANRQDLSTQFTILMPTVALDFGDAPDPVLGVPGRHPTLLANDGARHVVGDLRLGTLIDAETDGLPGTSADGDDLRILVSDSGALFDTSVAAGAASIVLRSGIDPATRDGDTITIDTGVTQATLEFDLNGRFNEDYFAIQPTDFSDEAITAAIIQAIEESPLTPASVVASGDTVVIDGDDEDGVIFTSETNPLGIFNQDVLTPIDVTVSGGGILQAWIDFNGDGDWDDPGENVITGATSGALFTDTGGPVTRTFVITIPEIAPNPPTTLETYARFRVSREGGLGPSGLALSGEVEDYVVQLVPGRAPVLTQAIREYTTNEDTALQAQDADGTLTVNTANDNGILDIVTDPDGDDVAVVAEDTGIRTLETADGTIAGELNLASDGTFTFTPVAEFSGLVSFTARVTDVHPSNPTADIVSSTPITVQIDVLPVNDPPVANTANVEFSTTINEDQPRVFTSAELITPFFTPGPANESGQPLFIQSASSARGAFLTSQGGTLVITDNGNAIRYTPPANFNGSVPDTFTYVVADTPPPGQLSQVAATQGTVVITVNAVNDPPIVVNENFNGQEDVQLEIPINGPGSILSNDLPGPQDEVDAGQQATLTVGQFPLTTFRGGTVELGNNVLIYSPPPLFSGIDQFDYSVSDSLGATSIGTASIIVGGTDNAPIFVGPDSLAFDESNIDPQQFVFDLQAWFNDPENDPLSFSVTSNNSSLVIARVVGETLVLDLPPFAFGDTFITVTATSNGLSTSQNVPISVADTPDPPSVIGTFDPANANEDTTFVGNLGSVFADPDNQPLTYSIARLGNLINPTAEQIAQNPLIQSIQLPDANGQPDNNIRVIPEADQFGSIEIEISASDGSFQVSDTFTLNILSVADAPFATADGYNVSVGSALQILNPAEGLLRNDSDADGDAIEVDLNSLSQPSLGTLVVESDGTFVYTNTSGVVGDTDSFTYRTRDSTGRISEFVTVTLTLNQSSFQNPIADLRSDVSADGFVTALDALRILNLLNNQANGRSFVPVSEIGAPPPDFVDVNGDGRVSSLDALIVINDLNQRAANGQPEGEFLASAFGTTTAFAATASNLPTSNFSPPIENESNNASDQIFARGVEISTGEQDFPTDGFEIDDNASRQSDESFDGAITMLADEFNLSNLQG